LKIKKLFVPTFSENGSNKRKWETETIYSWELFLQDIEENLVELKFEDLLVFITGADSIPLLGFVQEPTIEFYDLLNNERRFPWSSTCSKKLWPTGFERIIGSIGFGRAWIWHSLIILCFFCLIFILITT